MNYFFEQKNIVAQIHQLFIVIGLKLTNFRAEEQISLEIRSLGRSLLSVPEQRTLGLTRNLFFIVKKFTTSTSANFDSKAREALTLSRAKAYRNASGRKHNKLIDADPRFALFVNIDLKLQNRAYLIFVPASFTDTATNEIWPMVQICSSIYTWPRFLAADIGYSRATVKRKGVTTTSTYCYLNNLIIPD
ncbi:MAG: hypothetical protein ACI9ZF_002201 [Bradyrhizobium sp.]